MERTKGKIEHNDIKGWELWIGADYHIADVHGKALSRHANVEHIINCWNAFEPDGLVSELAGVLKEMDEYLDGKTMKLKRGQKAFNTIGSRSIFHTNMKEALAAWKKEIEK